MSARTTLSHDLAICFYLVCGSQDEVLSWPFQAEFSFKILNQRANTGHLFSPDGDIDTEKEFLDNWNKPIYDCFTSQTTSDVDLVHFPMKQLKDFTVDGWVVLRCSVSMNKPWLFE